MSALSRATAAILFVATLAGIGRVYADAQDNEILFGSVAMDIPAAMNKRLKPLTDYLSKTLGRPVALRLSPNMPSAIRSVADNEVQLAYLTPVAYLRAHAAGGSRLLVKTVTNHTGLFRLMIVVREDSPIHTVQQLAAKSFAFGDRAALLQRAVVVGAGMPLERLGSYKFIGHYDNIIRGVLIGDFDAGIVKDTMAYRWRGKGIRILYSSPNLPPYNISVSAKLDPLLYRRLRRAFLALSENNPDQRAVIKALDKRYNGFMPTSDAEYDVVRKLIAPFDKQR